MKQAPITESIETIRDKLVKLRALHAEGALADAAYEQGRTTLEQQLLDAILAEPHPPARPDSNGAPATLTRHMAAVLAAIVVVAGAGYWWKIWSAQSAPAPVLATGPAATGATAAALPGAAMPGATSATAAAARTVGGTVTISKSMAALAKPDDAVFIFAREAGGSRMPLAIIKRHVRDLPVTFTLDDRTSMSPTKKLSDVNQVIVGARVSKRDNPIPEKGDLSGLSDAVAVGTSDVRLEIREPYQQQ